MIQHLTYRSDFLERDIRVGFDLTPRDEDVELQEVWVGDWNCYGVLDTEVHRAIVYEIDRIRDLPMEPEDDRLPGRVNLKAQRDAAGYAQMQDEGRVW